MVTLHRITSNLPIPAFESNVHHHLQASKFYFYCKLLTLFKTYHSEVHFLTAEKTPGTKNEWSYVFFNAEEKINLDGSVEWYMTDTCFFKVLQCLEDYQNVPQSYSSSFRDIQERKVIAEMSYKTTS
ncbi:hypothetical protein CEXT_444611 [Caerostris extrusa]|uniref:Uncharacterized protein n=1 Tax=Caerostris extrusa TaxID=172846 RepID=A0AAV4W835_CAEEX|nr:hypothetical protein CEXT_444611 [Caerostris extrusa]